MNIIFKKFPNAFDENIIKERIDCKKYDVNIISIQDLIEGKYHTEKSKSDFIYAKRIKYFSRFQNFDLKNLNWIVYKNQELLEDIFKHHANNNSSIHTIANDIKTISRLLFIMVPKSKLHEKFISILKRLNNYKDDIESMNKLSELEKTKFIDWTIVLSKQKSIFETFNKLKNKQSLNAYKINQQLLLISMYSLVPPLRLELMNTTFITQENDNNGIDDFVLVSNDKVVYLLNKEKKKHEAIRIDIDDEMLKTIIKKSLELYPRKYVFTSYTNKNSKATTENVVKRMKYLFADTGKNVSVSALRSSFCSYNFENHAVYNDRVKAAKNMRTSVKAIDMNYTKTDKIIKENKQEVQVEPKKNNNIQQYLKEYYKKNKDNVRTQQTEYYKQNKDKKYIQKLLNRLNNEENYANNARKETLDKWKISLVNGQYIKND